MSLILDRLTVRAHYGAAKVKEISQLASPVLNRLIAAKRITETAGLLEHSLNFIQSMRSNIETIKSVEKHLKFLEDRGAIRVDDSGTIYVSTLPVDFGAIGKGVLDTDFTGLNLVLDARRSAEDFCPLVHLQPIAARFTEIFKESSNLSREGIWFTRFQRLVRRSLRHPILSFFTARELAAGHALFDANIKAADGARRLVKRFPAAPERIRLIEEKVQFVKSLPQHLVNEMLFSDPGPKTDNHFDIVISDLHIGSQSFGEEKEILRLCLLAKMLGAKLIINGDTFDKAEFGFNQPSAIKNNLNILRAFHETGARLIRGNHDDTLKSFSFELPDHQIAMFDPVDKIEMGGIYIEHGHQAGKMFAHSWWKPLYLPVSFLENVFGHTALKWMELLQREAFNLASSLANLFRRSDDKIDLWENTKVRSIVERARVLYREHGSKNLTIIIGHEHFAGVAATLKKVVNAIRSDSEIGGGKVKFYCSGGCKGREGYAADFLVIDSSDKNNPMVYPFVWEYTHDPVIVLKKEA